MTPSNSISDVTDSVVVYAILDGYGVGGKSIKEKLMNDSYLIGSKLAGRSPLLRFVGHVGGVVPKEQVRWRNTVGDIAGMEYVHTLWNFSVHQFVGHSMRKHELVLESYVPVASPYSVPGPEKAVGVGNGYCAAIESGSHRSEIGRGRSAMLCLHCQGIPPTTGGSQWLN